MYSSTDHTSGAESSAGNISGHLSQTAPPPQLDCTSAHAQNLTNNSGLRVEYVVPEHDPNQPWDDQVDFDNPSEPLGLGEGEDDDSDDDDEEEEPGKAPHHSSRRPLPLSVTAAVETFKLKVETFKLKADRLYQTGTF